MSDVRFGSWSVAESPISIEYSLVAIEEIRFEVAEGFQKLSRGGIEVGGVLYGRRDGRTISVLAMRPIACEHARGPAFLLSDSDRAALESQLERDPEDPRLEDMICVGWFLSHTRSEILLADSDLEIFASYFPAPWQVTLVIRPGRGGSMRAGFFVREPDGTVKSERSYMEFNFPDRLAGVLDRPLRSERALTERRQAAYIRRDGGAAPAPFRREMTRAIQPVLDGPQLLPSPPPKSKWPWLLGFSVAVLVLVLIGLRYFFLAPRTEPILLSVTERDGQLQIQWNHGAKPVTNAARGSLAIVDGKDVRTVALTPKDLARGSFAYERNSGDIEVRMTVEGPSGDKAEEASRFLGPPPVKIDPNEVTALQRQRDGLQAEVDRLRRDNAAESERVQELERTLRILQARMGGK